MIYVQNGESFKQAGPAVFLDRDGTVNIEKHHLFKIKDWEWIEGSKQAIHALKSYGYKIVIVSNQGGIGRGKYLPEDVNILHRFVDKELAAYGTSIDAYTFCPHHPNFTGECHCRKPSPYMLLHAAKKLNIDLSLSWMIGDKLIDTEAGLKAGVRPILVRSGYGKKEEPFTRESVIVANNLLDASELILNNNSSSPVAKE